MESNGNGRIVRLEVNDEWLIKSIDGINKKLDGLIWKVATIGGTSGLIGALIITHITG